jgi:hypothetical protein
MAFLLAVLLSFGPAIACAATTATKRSPRS